MGFEWYDNAVFPVAYTSAWSTSCIEMMTVSNKMKEIPKNKMQVMCIIVGFKCKFWILKVFLRISIDFLYRKKLEVKLVDRKYFLYYII